MRVLEAGVKAHGDIENIRRADKITTHYRAVSDTGRPAGAGVLAIAYMDESRLALIDGATFQTLATLETGKNPHEVRVAVRIHRSVSVNVDRIKSLRPLFNGDQIIVLTNGQELNLSRTYHERLMELLAR